MTDYEINGRVAKATQKIGDFTQARGKTFIHEHEDVGDFKNICIGWKEYDPCNNPADAWPIIVENKISIISMHSGGDGWQIDSGEDEEFVLHQQSNPLRAAMIVFLMMKDAEKC
ncbi:phage protein NinX family protein [Serratia marcescens]|uniref:phage protein NinX family protein n=1 Tax=Serratia marcescens TaxID=615 RepID=UPI000DFC6B5C|nr:phage protein NinX family protein [Serratia marcescens]SUI52321.1 Protein of uncharacterised function (DUF2591) [Serratia marcescens]